MWTDAATHQPVKYVMKTGDQVICMDISQSIYEPPETETPSQYAPSPDISHGTYIVPGTTTMYLYNFGTNGAHRDISKTEMENCMQMPDF